MVSRDPSQTSTAIAMPRPRSEKHPFERDPNVKYPKPSADKLASALYWHQRFSEPIPVQLSYLLGSSHRPGDHSGRSTLMVVFLGRQFASRMSSIIRDTFEEKVPTKTSAFASIRNSANQVTNESYVCRGCKSVMRTRACKSFHFMRT